MFIICVLQNYLGKKDIRFQGRGRPPKIEKNRFFGVKS
jgi:hypothetical protein